MSSITVLALLLVASTAHAAERPNIILMLADDQGWNGTSVPMHPDIPGSKGSIYRTPNLEKLASQGMRFSAAYAPAPVCSPTRISLQTGKSPAALHWTKAAPPEIGHKLLEPEIIKNIPASETTIAEVLRKAGYATAHYGKWHIRGGGPSAHGYDESDGDTGNEEAYKFTDPNPVDIFGMAKMSAAFMEKAKKTHKPFYIQLSWHALHAPQNALKSTVAKYPNLGDRKNEAVAPITEDLDTGVGMVLKSLDDLGLAGNTYVIYMSDNGAGGGGGQGGRVLNGGKGDVYEGGIRVPFIVRGPGVKANSWSHTRIVGYDLFPTFVEWAGLTSSVYPAGLEGGSIAGVIASGGQGKVNRAHAGLLFHFPHYQGDTPHSALIVGDLKIMKFYEDNRVALYDLAKEMKESTDLSKQRPDDTARLTKMLTDYLAEVKAQMPTVNAKYDPKAVPPAKKGMKKGTKPKA